MSTAPKPPAVNTTGPPTPASSTTSSPTATKQSTNSFDHQSNPMANLQEVVALMAKAKDSEKALRRMLATLETGGHDLASAGKAIQTAEKIETLRTLLTNKRTECIAAIDALEADLRFKVNAALKERLRHHVCKEIQGSVQSKINQKVREKLLVHIPPTIRDQTGTHKKRMSEIQMHLHNSEARRINATLSPDQPLKPLLRLPSSNAEAATPSDHFPATVNDCLKLKDDALKSLVREYGLRDLSPVREEKINKLLDFIGVPFQCMKIVPESGSSSPAGSKQPRMFLLDKPRSKFV
ncbi:hypothetical protein BDZ89DRAFT_1061302 [Hymenopellis radicata]|nr:hypothetical protein BDZ89DRAFT_1061302 [Hymenopellis radicata]